MIWSLLNQTVKVSQQLPWWLFETFSTVLPALGNHSGAEPTGSRKPITLPSEALKAHDLKYHVAPSNGGRSLRILNQTGKMTWRIPPRFSATSRRLWGLSNNDPSKKETAGCFPINSDIKVKESPNPWCSVWKMWKKGGPLTKRNMVFPPKISGDGINPNLWRSMWKTSSQPKWMLKPLPTGSTE